MTWGLYDTTDDCWLGNSEGPLTYDDGELAKVAARVLENRMKWPAGRVRAHRYDGGANVLKDEHTFERTAEESLERLEEGLDL